MRSEPHELRSATAEAEFAAAVEEKSRAKRAFGARSRRATLLAQILIDAGRGAREYVENWKAGRGAE